jgi:hypothetical protein
MSSALLLVLLVCNRRILRHRGKLQQHLMLILTDPHVRHFSDGSQTVCPTLKKINHDLILCPNNVTFFSVKISNDNLDELKKSKFQNIYFLDFFVNFSVAFHLIPQIIYIFLFHLPLYL